MKSEIPQRLCHLQLVMYVLRRSWVLEVVDHAIGQHPQRRLYRDLMEHAWKPDQIITRGRGEETVS